LMGLAASGIVADLLIKTFFAPDYGIFLRQMVRGALAALYSAAPRVLS